MTAPRRRICVTQIPSATRADLSENIAVASEYPPREVPFSFVTFLLGKQKKSKSTNAKITNEPSAFENPKTTENFYRELADHRDSRHIFFKHAADRRQSRHVHHTTDDNRTERRKNFNLPLSRR